MLWLYTSWLILMIGASVAFYHQRPEYLAVQRERARLSARVKEKIALLVMHKLAIDCYTMGKASSLADLTAATGVANDLASAVIETLDDAGFLARTAERADTYLPGRPLDTTTVADVIMAIRRDGEDKRASYEKLAVVPAVDRAVADMLGAAEAALAHVTIKDLALKDGQNPAPSA
jgi:membrane protein